VGSAIILPLSSFPKDIPRCDITIDFAGVAVGFIVVKSGYLNRFQASSPVVA